MTADALEAVLLWAAGRQEAPPMEGRLDESALLELVDLHALTARLGHWLKGVPAPWVSAEFRAELADLDLANRRQAAANLSAAAQITAIEEAGDPVMIKGLSTTLVTGLAHTLRCGDIDLVCRDGEEATNVLLRLDYRRSRAPFMHEVGEFTRGDTEVDLQSYFPVHSYTGLDRGALEPDAHPGVWVQPAYCPSVRPIDWALLERHRLDHRLPGGGRVFIPRPELLAIVLCAHAFMNFTNAWSISHREKPYVRLGELADLGDLTRDPRFDRVVFARLVHDLNAGDAVGWAAWAFESLIGPIDLPPALGAEHPRCLWWSWWANVPVAQGSWLRPDWYDMGQVTRALGANRVTLTGGRSGELSLHDRGALPRQLRLAQDAGAWPVSARFDDGGGTITLTLPDRPVAPVERVRIDFGSVASEVTLTAEAPSCRVAGSHLEVDQSHDGGRRALRVRFDPRRVGASLLIGIAGAEADGQPTSGVLVPIDLQGSTSAAL
jgi:hypothetical protein